MLVQFHSPSTPWATLGLQAAEIWAVQPLLLLWVVREVMPAPLGIERGYQKFDLAIPRAAIDLHWGVNSTLATLTLVHTCQASMPLGANLADMI